MFEYSHFQDSIVRVGGVPDPAMFERLDHLYSESTRFYHDRSHISECLTHFRRYRGDAKRPAEIEVAIWFHDAIYDTRASDNEERSAALAERHLSNVGVDSEVTTRVVDMILATKTHVPNSGDATLMVDIDLGILGASPAAFELYDQNIRREYHWVPEESYLQGRAEVLRSFLDRDVIYHSESLRSRLEARARQNLTYKLEDLDTKREALDDD